jgi:lytic murein transglycosylase
MRIEDKTTKRRGPPVRGLARAMVAAAMLWAMTAAATAQITGSVPPVGKPWSGESGASGHPEMTAAAIRDAAANFPRCLASLWPQAAKRGISRASFDAATVGLKPDLRIMDLMDSQPEFTKSFWDYLDVLVTDARIQKGRELLDKHRSIFDRVERAYGVDRYVLAAIWGVETNYGTLAGGRSVLRAAATLACVGRRQTYFREELLIALEILHRRDVRPDHLVGSWAGAFGGTQFMPRTFKRFAVDFDGDGRRDIVDSLPDMLASTANMMKKNGWIAGHSWGYEVVVPATLDFRLADRSHTMTLRDWQKHGVTRVSGSAFPRLDDRAYLLMPAGIQGPGFLMTHNFQVIMRYNPAEAYALAIGHLADRLRGGQAFVQDWPRYERVLSRAERLELQQLLARAGYDVGEPDGRLGTRTRAAIRTFQSQTGQVPDGFASTAVLQRLRGNRGNAQARQ